MSLLPSARERPIIRRWQVEAEDARHVGNRAKAGIRAAGRKSLSRSGKLRGYTAEAIKVLATIVRNPKAAAAARVAATNAILDRGA